ncbi:trans-sialidase, partial [Trypanosoma rangeli]
AVHAEEGTKPKEVQIPKSVGLLVPNRTIVETQGQSQTRDYFVSTSLASAGGVLVALSEGRIFQNTKHPAKSDYTDIVAGYVDSAEKWSSFVAEVHASKWRAHSIFNTTMQDDRSAPLRNTAQPTTIAKGNKVFLLVGGNHLQSASIKEQIPQYFQYLDLLVGEATENKAIRWGEPTSLLSQIEPSAKEKGIERFQTCGGSGVLMEDGTLVFPVMAMKGENSVASMMIYSKDGKTWGLPMNI